MLHPRTRRRRLAEGLTRAASVVILVALVAATSACAPRRDPTVAPQLTAPSQSDISTATDIVYSTPDGASLSMDACLPADQSKPAAAVILLHGGGFTQGSRSDESMVSICLWLAENGFAAFPTSYRFAPEYIYPSQTDDVAAAVDFLRQPEQVTRFNIDPSRIGALGSSAGAILTLQTATAGEGPTDTGARIAAAVSLSGVSDMRANAATLGRPSPEAVGIMLSYLGCRSLANCDGTAASPIVNVDSTDPPTLLAASEGDLVPIEQASAMADALESAGVPSQLISVAGSGHGAQLMNQEVRDAVLSFLTTYLAPTP